ncbi:MFS transporter [Albimonas pacifica]|uniref:Predicted arabinose efflux permease, MFS family n=1 Tax=Albimonas pacifica TaxID=1114924 RepID=A0A1I3ITF1_9RHOB|nr:MFS transporter [Albimonas pacifica]SFI51219.1 Predicted arabinose efflux permease, MFS family [Albimonas pacifica]
MLPAPFRHPAYRRYIAANFFGMNGSWMLRVAIAWLAWELTGSAAVTGVVSFLTFAPIVFSGPFFGVLADRIDPKRGIVAAQATQCLFGTILFGLALADALSAPVLLASALGMGLAASAYHPFRMALLPRLVPQEVLGQALAIGALNFNMTRMLGPALGGWLIHAYGAAGAVGVAAALFVPQVLAIASLGAYPPAAAEPDPDARHGLGGVLDQLAEGARYAMAQPLVREAVLMNALFAVAARGSLELLPVAADGLYNRGAGGFGILTATAGAGAVVAAVYMARGGQTAHSLRARARFATALGLLGTALLGLVGSWPAAIVTVALIGACGTMVGVANQTIAQLSTPEGKRGRVMSLWLISGIGGASIGSIGIGALADLIGLQHALVVTAIAMAALAPFVAWNLRGRETAAEPPAPPRPAPGKAGGGVGPAGAPTPGAVKRCANAPSRARR